MQIFENLLKRYPNNVELLVLEYKYLSEKDVESSRLLSLLEQAHTHHPGALVIYHYQILEYSRNGDVAGMYEAARQWQLHDPRRFQLPMVKALFADPGTPE